MSQLSKNIIYNIIGQGILIILSFVGVRFVFRQLGGDALGIIYFAITFNGILCMILQMGISSTLVREISSHFIDDYKYVNNLIRTASLFFWGFYFLISLSIYWTAPFIAGKWIKLQTMSIETAINVLQIMGITLFLALPRSIYVSIIQGLQRMKLTNILDVSTNALQQIGNIIILSSGGGLFAIVYWMAGCSLIGVLGYIFLAGRVLPSYAALIPGFSYPVIIRNLHYSSKMFFVSILSMIQSKFDKIIISKLLPIGILGFYSFAYGTALKGTSMGMAVAQAAFPSFSLFYKKKDRQSLLSQYKKLQDVLCFGSVPIFAAIIFSEIPLFAYLFNIDIAKMLLLPITFLCVGFYFHNALAIPYAISPALGKPEIVIKSKLWAMIINLPLAIWLTIKFGLNGAAFSLIMYNLLAYCYALPKVYALCLGLNRWAWIGHTLKIVSLISISFILTWIIISAFGEPSIKSLFWGYAFGLIIFIFGAKHLVADELRNVLSNHIRRIGMKCLARETQ